MSRRKWHGPERPPADREHYVAVDLAILKAVRDLAWTADHDRHVMPTIRAVLRVTHVDPTSGQVVIGVRLVRDLDEDKGGR